MALLFVGLGSLLVTETLTRSEDAAVTDAAKAKAVRGGESLLRRMDLELSQSCCRRDASLPLDQSQRMWPIPDGIQFEKIVGCDIDSSGFASQKWSSKITYHWDRARRRVTRQVSGGPVQVLATGVTFFDVQVTANGQVVITLETRSGAVNRGTSGSHRRVSRITPRNGLT